MLSIVLTIGTNLCGYPPSYSKLQYQLSLAVDQAADGAVHEDVAKIVKLHAKLALGLSFIPVPGADLAALAANTWTMYARINRTLGIPFSENKLKSLASGIATNLVSNLPILVAGSLVKTIPILGQFGGGAIMAASLYGVTLAAGIVYMKALTFMLNQSSELSEVNLKAAVDSLVQDKQGIQTILNDANREYRSAKKSGELKVAS
jgi:uncharacterized protein (DUF697 family)